METRAPALGLPALRLELTDDLLDVLAQRLEERLRTRPRFLSKDGLAEHLRVQPRTIKTWRSKGLPACKPGGGRDLMFDLLEVEKWLERHAT
jgi:hypothetical protein